MFIGRGTNKSPYLAEGGKQLVNQITFTSDFNKAKEISQSGKLYNHKKNYNLFPTLGDIERFRKKILSKPNPLLSCDIETCRSMSPYESEIMCIGFGETSTDGICIPFIAQGGKMYWTNNGDREEVKKELNLLFQNCNFMFFNGSYDWWHLKQHGYDIDLSRWLFDPFIMAHLLDPEMRRSLEFLSSMFIKAPYWKGTLKGNEILKLSDTELRTYNLHDCTFLFPLFSYLWKRCKERNMQQHYEDVMCLWREVILPLNFAGIAYDKKELNAWTRRTEKKLIEIEQQLTTEANLPPGFNLSSDFDIRFFLFGYEPGKLKTARKYIQTAKLQHEQIKLTGGRARPLEKKDYKKAVNLIEMFSKVEPMYKIPIGRKTKTGLPSVDAKSRSSIMNLLNQKITLHRNQKNQTVAQGKISKILKLKNWLFKLDNWTETVTLLNRYGNGAVIQTSKYRKEKNKFDISKDGRIHGSYGLLTDTFRWACRNPNMHNTPAIKDPTYKKIFIAPPGRVLIEADYSNAEFIALAYICNDPGLIEVVQKGLNIHDVNTEIFFNIKPGHSDWKLSRFVCKKIQFGVWQYGGQPKTIYQNILVDVPNFTMTLKEFEKLIMKGFSARPVQKKWIQEIQQLALTTRQVEIPVFGYVRKLYGSEMDIKKHAINTPIQGFIACLVNKVVVDIGRKLKHLKLDCFLVGQKHDSLTYESNLRDALKASEVVQTLMEQEIEINGHKVKFPVDLKIGFSLGETLGKEKFFNEMV